MTTTAPGPIGQPPAPVDEWVLLDTSHDRLSERECAFLMYGALLALSGPTADHRFVGIHDLVAPTLWPLPLRAGEGGDGGAPPADDGGRPADGGWPEGVEG